MEQPPALTPEEVHRQSHIQHAHLGRPTVVTIFAIMHIIFGAIGILTGIWGLLSPLVMGKFAELGASDPTFKKQMEMQSDLAPFTIGFSIVTLIVAALMLTAGIKMIRSKRDGRMFSNYYAWGSIGTKILSIPIAWFVTLPMSMTMFDDPAMPGMSSMKTIMYITTFGSIIAYAIYPTLSLILLNRPKIKEWFSAQSS